MQNESGAADLTLNNTVPQAQYTSNETLVAFVESAAAYVRENGKEKALAEFSDPNGSFIQGELYIYAYDFNGTTLAHPVNPEKVGVNRLNETEGNVGAFLRKMNDAIRSGESFHRIAYINPAHNGAVESKLTYAVQMDENWWLGSGIYTGPADLPAAANPTVRADYPTMVGVWRADDGAVYSLNDTIEEMPAGENTWVVNAQNDRVISGFKVFSLPDGTVENQTFVGIFNPDKETISFIDQPGGWATGSLADQDTLFIAWTNPGGDAATMAGTLTLHRDNTA
ncbi:cache domain-containing protein [Methanoculleus sp.]|uniref:cache domain-containing protein n=1 Tax=Methanoculleus sp. TaxID=90427 RepID=UPI0025DAEDB7|nr:cache domain-containing protein [Methanoculleus sp.]